MSGNIFNDPRTFLVRQVKLIDIPIPVFRFSFGGMNSSACL